MSRIQKWLRNTRRRVLRNWISQDACSNVLKRNVLRFEPLEDRTLMAVAVSSFTPTPSGFVVQFTEEIRVANLNLYDAQNGAIGAADVTLRGSTLGDIRGSVVTDGFKLSFIASGGVLPPDNYTAVLRSNSNAIVDAALGQLLDGEFTNAFPSGNGTPGGDFVFNFNVTSSALVIGLPDFSRGPSQNINVPAVGSGQSPSSGLPIRLSNAQGVTSLTFTLTFDPALLNVSQVKLGRDAPTGSQVESNLTIPGQITVAFFALEPLTSGFKDIIEVVASVPETATYGKAQVLRFQSLDVNAGAVQVIGDEAIHVVAFPGDANGNQRYDAEDARLIARVGVGLDTGFVVADPSGPINALARKLFPNIDPTIIGDVTGVDGISPLDASDVLRRVAGLPTLNIPAIPTAQAPTALGLSSTTISDGVSIGTVVGNFTTTDPDLGDTHTYSFVAGPGSTDNLNFTIVGNQLRTAVNLNATVKSTYSIRIQTTDASGRSLQQTFQIAVTQSNRVPTSVSLSNRTVSEAASIGTSVGLLSTTDPDAGDTHSYSLVVGNGDDDNASFLIVGSQVQTAIAFNAEAKSSYTVRVRSTDASGLFVENVFVITISNTNEVPTSLSLNGSTVAENSAVGTTVGSLSTLDPDVGDTHTYSLVSGNGDTDNASFTLVGNQLQTSTSLDFETISSYSIRIRSTDAGGLFTESVFVITVTNVNEVPTNVALSNSTVSEVAPIGTTVGLLSTTDPDAGDTHSYSLVVGNGDDDNANFLIVGNEIQIATAMDFILNPSYSVRIRSTDASGLFVESLFTITAAI